MAGPKLTALKCPTCSAPLQVPPNVSDVQCQYCKNAIHIERTKAPTQVGGFHMPNTVYVDPNVGRNLGLWIALGTILPIIMTVGIGGASFFRATRAIGGSGASFGIGGPRTADSFPVTCGMNEEVTITGKTFTGTGTLITTDINCKLTIKDSTLKGDVVLETKNMGEITIQNSKLEGKEHALLINNNGKVKITDHSEIRGTDKGIEAGMNIELTVDGSKVYGTDSGIHANTNFKLKATGAEISGKEKGLDLESNAELTLKQTTIKAEDEAIHSDSNLVVNMDGSTIEGTIGVKTTLNPKLKVAKKSRVAGKDQGVACSSNLELAVEDSIVESPATAVQADVNAKVKVTKGGKIKGGKVGVASTHNLELSANEGTIESAGNAVESSFNSRIELKASTVSGGQNALALQRKPSSMSVSPDSKVTGAQNFNFKGK